MIADPKAMAGNRTTEPPVTDVELEQLNTKARGIMFGLGGELQQAQVMLRQPPRPTRPGTDPANGDVYANGSSPIIPPIVPIPITASPQVAPPATTMQPVTTPSAPSTGPVLGAGPVLGGAGTGVASSPVSTTLPGVTSPTTPTSPSVPGIGMPPALPPASTSGRLPNASIRGGLGPHSGTNGQPHTSLPRPFLPRGLEAGTWDGPGTTKRQYAASAGKSDRWCNR